MKPYRNLFLGTLVVISLSQSAQADTYNWNGLATGGATGISETWDTVTANWIGFGTTWPAASTTNDDAVFGGTVGTVTIGGAVTANELTFNADGYTLTGAGITLDGTTPTITTADFTQTTISSIISGTAGLIKAGPGNLTLSGANNYTGTTTIDAGTLIAGNAAALGSNVDGTTVSASGALDVGGQNLGTEVVTISGAGPFGDGAIVNTGVEQINATGRIVLAGNATIGGGVRWDLRNSTPTLNMAGFTLTKTGANYLGLVGATISNPGNVVVNQGELNLTFGSTFGGIGATNTVTVNTGSILGLYNTSNIHGSTLNLNDGSTLRGESGSGTQNNWSGPIAVAGEVTLDADAILNLPANISGTANLTKTGGSTAILSGTNSITSTNLTINAGSLQINTAASLPNAPAISVASGASGALVLGNSITVGSGKTITIAGGGANTNYGAISAAAINTGTSEWQGNVIIGEATGTRVGSLGGILHISGNISETNTGSALLIRNDENVNATVTLSGNNNYTGTTTLSASNLRIGSATALGSGPFLVDSAARAVSVSSTDTTPRTITNATTLNSTTATLTLGDATRNGKLTFSNTIALGTAVRLVATNSEVEFAGSIGGAGGGITKSGTATLILSGNNDYSGATTVSAGTLKLNYTPNDGSKLADGAALTLAGGTLELAGNPLAPELVSGTTLTASTASTVTRTAGSAVLQMNGITRNSSTYINFAQSGIATTDTTNTNGILGTWATIGGTDWASNSTNAADGLITPPTYTLSSDASDTATNYAAAHITVDSNQTPGALIAPNSLRFNGPGGYTLTLQGANSIATGGILVSTGTGSNTSTITGGTLTGPVSGDLIIHQNNPSGNLVIASQIINNTTTNVVKTGIGPATLSGDNTYTGTTIVSGGTLTLSGNKTGNSGAITVSNLSGLNATLNISAGTYAVGGNNFIVGNAQGVPATGTVNQTGGVVSFSSGNGLLLGNAGTTASTGIYNLSNGSITTGTAQANRGVIVGTNTNSINIFNLSGTGFLNMNAATGGTATSMLQIGRFDSAANTTTNTFNQSGGTANVAVFSVGGNGSTGTGISSTVNWTDGVFVAESFPRLSAGNTNTATLTISGNANVTLPAFPTTRGTSSTATLNFDGGVLKPFATSATYLGGLTNAFIKAGGAKFNVDTGKDITVSQALLTDPVSTGGGLTKEGPGVLTLSGASTFTGDVAVNAGTLQFATGLSLAGTPILKLGDTSGTAAATLSWANNGLTTNHAVVVRSGSAGTKSLLVTSGVTASVASLELNDNLSKGSGGTLNVTGATTLKDGNRSIAVDGGTLTLGGTLSSVGGTHNLSKSGASILRLDGNNSGYAGTVTLTQGSLHVGHLNGLGTGAFINSSNANTLTNVSGTAITLSNSSYSISNSLIFGGSASTADINTGVGAVALVGSQRILSVSSGVTATIGAAISGDLRKDGSGTLVLAGTGAGLTGIRVVQGNLQLTGSTAPTTNLISGHPSASNVGKFILGGAGGAVNQTFDSLSTEGSAQASQSIVGGNASVSTLTINQPTTTTYAGVLGGAGDNENNLALTKDGSGSLALTGTTTYIGNTTVTAGTLSLGNGTANTGLADGADVSIAAGATLNLNFDAAPAAADTVAKLFLGTPPVQVPAGTYNSSHPTYGSYFTGTGSLIVANGPSGDDYATWAGPGGFNLSGGPTADDDGDGLSNFEEYTFGLDPTTGSSVNPITQPLDKATGTFKYTRRATPATTGVTYTYESSTTLNGTWPGFTPTSAVSNNASPVEEITVTVPGVPFTDSKLFIRVKATKP